MKEGLQYFTDTYLTSIGLFIFFAFFVGVLFWAYRPRSKELYQHIQNFPLNHGE